MEFNIIYFQQLHRYYDGLFTIQFFTNDGKNLTWLILKLGGGTVGSSSFTVYGSEEYTGRSGTFTSCCQNTNGPRITEALKQNSALRSPIYSFQEKLTTFLHWKRLNQQHFRRKYYAIILRWKEKTFFIITKHVRYLNKNL